MSLTITVTSASFYDATTQLVPPAEGLLVITDLEGSGTSPTDRRLMEQGGGEYFDRLRFEVPFVGRRVVRLLASADTAAGLPFKRVYFVPEPDTYRFIDTALFSGLCMANADLLRSVIIAPVQSDATTQQDCDEMHFDPVAMAGIAEGIQTFVATVLFNRMHLEHIQIRTGSTEAVSPLVIELNRRMQFIHMTHLVPIVAKLPR